MQSTFGEFLKHKRQEKNLTQKQLANILFVSPSAVSKWEKDIAHPDISLLPQLCQTLEVSEHELITACIDKKSREEKIQAKKWRNLASFWSLFFYISYGVALVPCFICNLAINKTLSWFWIVFAALLLSFSFTNLPRLIKKHKLLLIPIFNFLSLCILLATCAIYTKGDWFFIVFFSVLFALIAVFFPIYVCKYKIFTKIRKINDFVSVAIDFLTLNVLLIVIENYTLTNGYSNNPWYLSIALPIVAISYLVLNLYLSIRLLKLNKLLKTCIILAFTNILYIIPAFIKIKNTYLQHEIDDLNIFKANFYVWLPEITLENNIHCIIFLTILLLSILFFIFGLIKHLKHSKKI